MSVPQISLSVMATILLTGAVLNVAGSGMLGTSVEKLAKYITKGYGV